MEGHAYLRLLRSYLDQYLPRTAQQKASNNAIGHSLPPYIHLFRSLYPASCSVAIA